MIPSSLVWRLQQRMPLFSRLPRFLWGRQGPPGRRVRGVVAAAVLGLLVLQVLRDWVSPGQRVRRVAAVAGPGLLGLRGQQDHKAHKVHKATQGRQDPKDRKA